MKPGARRWRRRWDDYLSAYLPVILMALFALFTAWLVRNMPRLPDDARARPLRHEADYFMRDFSVLSFDAAGRMKSELLGAHGQHYPDTDTVDIEQPRLHAVDAQGRITRGSALRARSNGDGSEIELFGQAQVRREPVPQATGSAPALEFRGEYLQAFVKQDRVRSDQPVELRRGRDVFTGDRFDYDHGSGVANLNGRVRGVIQPANPR